MQSAKEGLEDVRKQATEQGFHVQAVAIQEGIHEIVRLEDELGKVTAELEEVKRKKAAKKSN